MGSLGCGGLRSGSRWEMRVCSLAAAKKAPSNAWRPDSPIRTREKHGQLVLPSHSIECLPPFPVNGLRNFFTSMRQPRNRRIIGANLFSWMLFRCNKSLGSNKNNRHPRFDVRRDGVETWHKGCRRNGPEQVETIVVISHGGWCIVPE